MKILSKYKDYYDYLVSKYGMDEKFVLDRRKGRGLALIDFGFTDSEYSKLCLHICGRKYDGAISANGKFYWLEDLKTIAKQRRSLILRGYYKKHLNEVTVFYGKYGTTQSIIPTETELNDKINCPIILELQHRREPLFFPKLSDLKIAKVLPPDEIWNMLYNWLSSKYNIDIKDNRTDIEKLKSCGFDEKQSFRHRK